MRLILLQIASPPINTHLFHVIIFVYRVRPELVSEELEHIFLPGLGSCFRRHLDDFSETISLKILTNSRKHHRRAGKFDLQATGLHLRAPTRRTSSLQRRRSTTDCTSSKCAACRKQSINTTGGRSLRNSLKIAQILSLTDPSTPCDNQNHQN